MKNLTTFVIGLAVSAASFAAQPLLKPAELAVKLQDPNVRVIDIRDAKSYAANHIPGAVNAPYQAAEIPHARAQSLPAWF